MSRKLKMLAVGIGVTVTAVVGVAYALWNATGTGPGRARSGEAVELTIIASDGTPDLFPGFTDGDVYFTIQNPNPFAVTFTAATAGAITSSDPTGCPASNITVDDATGLTLQVGASTTSPQLSIADIVTMSAAAPDGCQNVSFDIALTLTGTQD
jgi:hypothetical protein